MHRRSLASALVAGAVLLSAGSSQARDFPQLSTDGGKTFANGFDLQLFRPAIDTKGYLTLNASQVLGLWDISFGLVGTIAGQPLRLEGIDKTDGNKFNYDFLLTPSLQFAVGFKYAELALTLPVQIASGSGDPSPYINPTNREATATFSYSGQAIGDLGIHVKGRFLNTSKHAVGLAALVSLYIPLSDQSRNLLSDGTFGIRPTIIIDRDFGRTRRLRAALNLGAHIRTGEHTFTDVGATGIDSKVGILCGPLQEKSPKDDSTYCGTQQSRTLGMQITYGLGVSYAAIKEKLDLLAELYGAVGFTPNSRPLELVVGVKIYLARNSFMSIGGGTSVIPNQTQGALWRGFLGFVFEPAIGDRDGDGIKDDVDRCPDDPEDIDDFEDGEGCPDPDNDRDGILDVDDKCANEPETKNGFQDEDGCADVVELDRDGDGIPDSADKCPDDPEDKDEFEDDDGCPDPDNDQDGVLDIDDKDPISGRSCANDPEDKDGFEDVDGCPDPDNDKDRILDVNDTCPNEPETYNGVEDKDGCPDKGRVIIRAGKIEILDKIFFETDKAIILPVSFPLLDAISATLIGNPQIALVEIQGHADERATPEHNMKLTKDRAEAVRQYLVDHKNAEGKSVDGKRLQARGFGATKPICKEHNEDCWSKNRRVEFLILKRIQEEE